eukprot:CAMPEP_0204554774 /NCGR_PEP_ID=MMETSP0661-20131031/28361_1 /ASSEMBLY_ACC=CAM_ASM_000606 /TAXON_ID=109239 /ORGANISM="Alexandrium margalefi, Strain AMGDE01CS-322" /LENGTH=154 /DNA_ID=CAMNT_0051561851 /DNA_START=60 /DNA_END=520 /DNA_ORIENTATION=+
MLTAFRSELPSRSSTAVASASRALRLRAPSLAASASASSISAWETPASLAQTIAFWIASWSPLPQALTSQDLAAILRFSICSGVCLAVRGVALAKLTFTPSRACSSSPVALCDTTCTTAASSSWRFSAQIQPTVAPTAAPMADQPRRPQGGRTA